MLIIDRLEHDFAVVEYESGKTFNLPRLLLPRDAKEGNEITLTATVDSSGTKERRKNIERLMDDLFE
jgi:hypothetical protein